MGKYKRIIEEQHVHHHIEVDGNILVALGFLLALLVISEKILRILL